MSEGHPETGTDGKRDMDFGDMTDDKEVELNLAREEAVERDPPGEDTRDLPGATSSGRRRQSRRNCIGWTPRMGLDRNGTVTDGHFR